MSVITLGKVPARSRTIDIQQFKKEMFEITESTLRIWKNKKCCWRCKNIPAVGEKWGLSINVGEKNRLFCPTCAEYIEKELAGMERADIRVE